MADEEERMAGSSAGDDPSSSGREHAKQSEPPQSDSKRLAKKLLSERKLQRMKEAMDRRGIIYISRIPPHMKPQKLRQLMEQYGEVGRLYCAPEDSGARKKRKLKGGNSGKNFTEGWVEFEDKRVAKRVAALLNGQPIGGRKRSAYHFDLWCLKYLSKFKWDALTEEIAYARAVREQKLANELAAAKRERDFYLSRVDKAKAVDAIRERKRRHAPEADGSEAPSHSTQVAPSGGTESGGNGGYVRHYGQRRAKADPVADAHAPELADDVLSMIARRKSRAVA